MPAASFLPRVLGFAVFLAALASGLQPASSAEKAPGGFVGVQGTGFVLDGQPFRVAGVNNHYLTFGSREEVTRVLDDAVAMNANVVRTFIQPVMGSLDGKVPTIWNWQSQADSGNLGTKGIYMMRWDTASGRMLPNDGPDGLQKVDFLIAEASRRNLRLILAFVDFWAYTGGAQQMSAWYGSSDKYTFFAEDPRTRQDYKDWVRHVLTRVNSLTGVRYSDDPTIFAWDLANEPDIHPAPLLADWLTEMSAYVKSLAPFQLVTTGHANMKQRLADIAVPSVDFATWHGYATYEKMTPAEFDGQIRDYCRIGEERGKPVLLEEFGLPRDYENQAGHYRTWLNSIKEAGCAGWVVWRLVGKQDSGAYPEDEHDKFDIRNDAGATWNVLREAASALRATETPAASTSAVR